MPFLCPFSTPLDGVIPTVFFGLFSQATHCCLYFSCHQIALVMRFWVTTTPEPAKCSVAVLLLAVFHLICPDCQQLCHVGTRNVTCHNQDRLQRSLNSEGCSWFPARHHLAPPRHSISHWTSSTGVHRCIIHQPAQDVVQFCDMSCTIILNNHVLHCSIRSCLPDNSFCFVTCFTSTKLPRDLTSPCVIAAQLSCHCHNLRRP